MLSNTLSDQIIGHVLHVDRAISDVRRGQAVALQASDGRFMLVLAAEYAADAQIKKLELLGGAEAFLLISPTRAKRFGIEIKQGKSVRIAWSSVPSEAYRRALIDPTQPVPETLPLTPLREELAWECDSAAIQLMKLAQVLPVAVVVPVAAGIAHKQWTDGAPLLVVQQESLNAYPAAQAATLEIASRARVPLAGATDSHVVAFRSPTSGQEHIAIIIGEPAQQESPLVRVHSSCLTGDVLGSLRCDCGDQLKKALHTISQEKHGVIIYLNQEGRGIGIVNKLRAYALQDAGVDTVDANEELGFQPDERDFAAAAVMLARLGITQLRLMTNNPQKVDALHRLGVRVTARVPHVISPREENRSYLETKAKRCGHLL